MQKMKSLQLVLFALLLDNITWGQSQNGNAIRKAESVSIHPIVNSINQFGFRLSTKMMESSSDNIVISPTSVAGLLSMTLLGSVGKTYDELAAALGFSQDILMNRNNHKEFGELLNTVDGINPASTTLSASAVAVDARARLRNEYRDYLNRIYKAEVINVNFEDSNETKKIINEWVCRHTEGHINEFLKQPLHFDTKVVLLNVLYFSGQWAYPFLPEYTRNMSFVTPRGVVNAELMLNSGEFDYVFSPNLGVHMIALPYNDSATTMYVLKPFWPKRLSLPELMRRLDHEIINNLINEMTTTKVVIRFPKMQIESKIDLTNTLKALGLTSMFSQGIANFALMVDSKQFQNVSEVQILSRINSDDETAVTDVKEILNNLPNPKIYVDSVIHNVKLTIDEFGTEAAAVTTGILARTAELFYADSPFFMFIRDERTKLITFSATIFDPII